MPSSGCNCSTSCFERFVRGTCMPGKSDVETIVVIGAGIDFQMHRNVVTNHDPCWPVENHDRPARCRWTDSLGKRTATSAERSDSAARIGVGTHPHNGKGRACWMLDAPQLSQVCAAFFKKSINQAAFRSLGCSPAPASSVRLPATNHHKSSC